MEYYIIVDKNHTPIVEYVDEVMRQIEIYPSTLDEVEVHLINEKGKEDVEVKKTMWEEYGIVKESRGLKIEKPLKVVKLKSERKIIL